NTTLLLMTIDVMGADRSFVDGIKASLHERFNIKPDEVMINFSHTHSSIFLTGEDPDERSRSNYSIAQLRWPNPDEDHDFIEDMKLYRELKERIVAAVAHCFDTLQDSELSIAKGTSD